MIIKSLYQEQINLFDILTDQIIELQWFQQKKNVILKFYQFYIICQQLTNKLKHSKIKSDGMRNSSTSKKRHQYDKYIESRVLATSNSLNPLSKHISTKLDLIKQQISRQFHEKFPTERKRTTSVKKTSSSSKSKLPRASEINIQSINKKLQFDEPIPNSTNAKQKVNYHNITELHSENENYRQKFYELQDKFMDERKKIIQDFQKSTKMKEKFIDFLQQPSIATGDQLRQYFPTDRHKKVIQKFVNMNEDVQYAEKVLTELLSIVQVEDIESLLTELKSRQTGYKTLSQCTFKIVQLETAYNRLNKDCEQKIEKTILQYNQRQQQLKNEMEEKVLHFHSIIQSTKKEEQQNFKKMVIALMRNINKIIDRIQDDEQELKQKPDRNKFMYVTFQKVQMKQPRKDSQISRNRPLSASSIVIDNQQTIERMFEQILQIIAEMQRNLCQIQMQAELNAEKLNVSKQDLDRLQKLIEKVTNETEEDKNRLVQHFKAIIAESKQQLKYQIQKWQQLLNQQKDCHKKSEIELGQLKPKIKQISQQLNETKKQSQKKQQLIHQIIEIICQTTGEDIQIFGLQAKDKAEVEMISQLQSGAKSLLLNKIQFLLNKHLLALKEDLQSAQNMILWHEKELEIKEALLKQFDFNLKKLIEDSQNAENRQKTLEFQRDQYKYLLSSLRQNIRETKAQHLEQMKNLQQKKDAEYLNSNKSILLDNQRLNEQIMKLKENISQLSDQIKSESASHGFYRKKAEQFQSNLVQLRKKVLASEAQANRYKQHLSEIQMSFKEVQNMSEINSNKMISLEEENKLISNQATDLRVKVQQLQASIQMKDDNYNKLTYSFEEMRKKYDNVCKNKEDVQNENSELRLKNLQILQERREQNQKWRKLEHQNAGLSRENKKFLEQINQLTKKLLNYVGQKQLTSKSRKQIKKQIQDRIENQFKALKDLHHNVKITIKDLMTECKDSMKQQCDQINTELESNFKRLCDRQRGNKQADFFENYEQLLKQQVKNERLEKIIKQTRKNLNYTKDEVNNLKQYCKFITTQFDHQIKYVSQMLCQPDKLLVRQAENISQNFDRLLKIILMLNSLKNEGDQIKQMVSQRHKQMFKQFETMVISGISRILENGNTKVNSIDQGISPSENQFDKYIKRQEQVNQVVENQKQYKSPQFAKARRKTISEKANQSQNCSDNSSLEPKNQPEIQEEKLAIKLDNQNQSFEDNQDQIKSERVQYKTKNYSLKGRDSSYAEKEDEKLRWSGVSMQNEQAERVKKILLSLKLNQGEEPKISYFKLIKNQYRAVKQKLLAKNLTLDISAVSFRHNSIASPSSVSFSKDFLFDKRFNTQPNQDSLPPRQTNRSEHRFDRNNQDLKKQNEELKEQLQQLDEQIKIYEYREQQYKTSISQLEKQKTELENQTSKQMKQKLFLKFITDLCKENWKEVESSCKIILKLLGIQAGELNEKMEAIKAFITKYEKKSHNGFMSGFFNKNSKG